MADAMNPRPIAHRSCKAGFLNHGTRLHEPAKLTVIAAIAGSLCVGFWAIRPGSVADGRDEASVEFQGRLDSPLAGIVRGVWTINGFSWNLTVREVDCGGLENDSEDTSCGINDSIGVLIEEDGALAVLRDRLPVLHRRGTRTVRGLTLPDLRLRMVTERTDTERVLGGSVAYPAAGSHWTMITATPRVVCPTPVAVSKDLLPLPSQVDLVAARHSFSGDIQCQIVKTMEDRDAIVTRWQGAGWKVEPSPAGKSQGTWLLCSRGGDAVHVWLQESGVGHPALLLLVKVPAVATSDPSHPLR